MSTLFIIEPNRANFPLLTRRLACMKICVLAELLYVIGVF